MSLFKLSKAVQWSVSEWWSSDLWVWKITFCRLHSSCWEEHCYVARAGESFWHGGLPCLPLGIWGSFLSLLKAQAGEVESKGNTGLGADTFWWGWHRGLQPRLYPEERLPLPSHLSAWFCEKARTAPTEGHLPFIHSQKSPAIHKWRRQEDLPKTKLEPKARYMHISPRQRNVLLVSLPQVCISQVTPL